MIILPSPTQSFVENRPSLAGKTYVFIYRFNEVSGRWYLDIYLDNVSVILGVALVEGQPLFSGLSIPNFDHGILTLLRITNTKEKIGRYNFGVDKDWVLVYLTNEEWNSV